MIATTIINTNCGRGKLWLAHSSIVAEAMGEEKRKRRTREDLERFKRPKSACFWSIRVSLIARESIKNTSEEI